MSSLPYSGAKFGEHAVAWLPESNINVVFVRKRTQAPPGHPRERSRREAEMSEHGISTVRGSAVEHVALFISVTVISHEYNPADI